MEQLFGELVYCRENAHADDGDGDDEDPEKEGKMNSYKCERNITSKWASKKRIDNDDEPANRPCNEGGN